MKREKPLRHSPAAGSFLFIGIPLRKPRLLIPLASPRVQALSLGLYSPGSSRGKLFKWFGRIAAAVGLMKMAGRFLAAPVDTFKATDDVRPILDGDVFEALQSAWEELLGKGPVSVALSLGGPNHYRKVTALVFDQRAKPLAFAKVGCTPQAGCLIANERMALETFRSMTMQSAVIPALLGHGKIGPASWMLQSALLAGSPSPVVLQNEHIDFLADLSLSTTKVMPLRAAGVWKQLHGVLNKPVLQIKSGFEAERSFISELVCLFHAFSSEDFERSWPVTAAHGDFAPWNMRLTDGKIALFDWEYFLPAAPAGWDLLYFIFRVENLIKRQSLEKIWAKFEAGAYQDSLTLWEKQAGLQVPNRRLLAMFVLLSIALDLVPEWICGAKGR